MNMSEQDLKQQLSEAISARKALEYTYEKQFKLLAQFVHRLSFLSKGVDLELDNRLAKLRVELGRNADLEKLLPFIDETSDHIKHLEQRQQQALRQVQSELTQAGRLLQQQKGLPDQLRRDLRQLLSQLEQPAPTIHTYLPHLTQLTQLYQHTLATRQQSEQQDLEPQRLAHLCRQITHDLTNLLSELSFSGNSATEIAELKSSLLTQLSIEALLDACIRTIQIIVRGINQERLSAENFLLRLNDALASVQQAVESSLQNSGHLAAKLAQLNQKIEAQIDHLGTQSQQAESLEQLKQLVVSRMTELTQSLQEREALEQQQRTQIQQILSALEQKVKELEQEAQGFRQRIAEQNFRSLRDSLTGIANRAAYDERLQLEFKRWQRFGTPLCIVLADVDHFKTINDNYGHSAGDKTLKVIAKTLQQAIRKTDFIARYGGEEFVILLPDTELSNLAEPLNLIREKIKTIPFKFKNKSVPITISLGATQLKHGDSLQTAFERADQALYQAKKAGRDRVVTR
ncbi:sensor domain-containing diguanylate cyclase [Alishewanella jeotgali]|uniref:diguanylate cyclase n=1 Tax=Alishewanella jeotgali KCTC 22429 TaxID=1129374 RepID=H3ZHA9_9ALTE|nr:GGDEF domain-containing protein [Alishewanella jeotgali]EHR40065.1 hypothetical protein AJE_13899 [Alishewanella jeotgali KCTC 22429]